MSENDDLDAIPPLLVTVFLAFIACLFIVGYISNDFGFRSGYCAALDGTREGSVCLLPDGTFEEVQRD